MILTRFRWACPRTWMLASRRAQPWCAWARRFSGRDAILFRKNWLPRQNWPLGMLRLPGKLPDESEILFVQLLPGFGNLGIEDDTIHRAHFHTLRNLMMPDALGA